MAVSITKTIASLKALLPKGRIWQADEGSVLYQLLYAIAVEITRVETRVLDLLNEADPNTTYELIEEWEKMLGLPDDCTGTPVSLEQRRQLIIAKLTQRQSLTKQYFIDLANSLGYEITVDDFEEFSPFRAGISRAGERLFSLGWVYVFALNLPLDNYIPFRAGTHSAGERLVEFGDDVLECLVNENKPAHTVAIFQYS